MSAAVDDAVNLAIMFALTSYACREVAVVHASDR